MKNTLRRSILLGSLAALSLAAFGCGGTDTAGSASSSLTVASGPQAEARGFHGRRHDPARFVARFDANHDGSLQVGELPAPMQARLTAADANHDGVIAAEELSAHHAARRAERFARADTNGDGAITADEAGEGRWAHLNAADADHDGRVSRTELESAMASGAMMRGPHGPRGDGPDEGGPHGRRGFGRRGFGPGGHAPNPARMIQRFDANGDGALQVSELPAPMQTRMAAADANHDGVVAESELAAAIAAHRAEREAQRGERGAAEGAPEAE